MLYNTLELIYSNSPIIIQNLAVSAKGLALENLRKRGLYNDYKQTVIDRHDWSREQFDEHQLSELRNLIDHARHHVPYYNRLLNNLNITSESLTCLSDINKLPILHRDIVKQHPGDFISSIDSDKEIVSLQTTGTTGSPLKISSNRAARQKNYAFFDGYLNSINIDSQAKHIIIGGRVVVPQKAKNPPFWRYSYFQKSLLMSSYHLNDKYMDSYIDKIEKFNPEYIESYPSSIYTLAKYILKKKRKLHCKAIITSAETLFPEQRDIIEQAFDTKLYDQYGCAEMSFFAAQCSHGRYHLRPDYGLFELLDDDGKSVEPGQSGRVVCTGFINETMPLIRYEIGDMATFSKIESCECGLNTPILQEIQGRIDDVLYTNDGRAIGRMSPVLKGLPVLESQYIQHEVGEVSLLIVPDDTYVADQDTQRIIDAVQLRLGTDFHVDVSLVNQIKRGKGGKLKSVISHIKN